MLAAEPEISESNFTLNIINGLEGFGSDDVAEPDNGFPLPQNKFQNLQYRSADVHQGGTGHLVRAGLAHSRQAGHVVNTCEKCHNRRIRYPSTLVLSRN